MSHHIELPPLPFAQDALAPVISAQTLSFHYGKHHKAYVDNLNKLVAGTDLAEAPLEVVIKAVAGKPDKVGIFNNAAQTWNHTFFWNSLKPGGGGAPTGAVAKGIDAAFGSFDNFKKEFANAAMTQFGSGWAWLVADKGQLKVVKTGERRHAAHRGCDATGHHRRLGARLLPGLPEPARRFRGRRDRQAAQLGVRQREPRARRLMPARRLTASARCRTAGRCR